MGVREGEVAMKAQVPKAEPCEDAVLLSWKMEEATNCKITNLCYFKPLSL